MPSWRVLNSVLGNFLGTITSRHTDFEGYWAFGFLLDDESALAIDLLQPPSPRAISARDCVVAAAATKFHDQLSKARVLPSRLSSASLRIAVLPGIAEGFVNGHRSIGRM